MQCCSKKHHRGFFLSLLLIFAVTFWGVHDKASLYEAGAHGLPIAKAKLLSGRELAADVMNQVKAVLPTALPTALPTVLFAAFTPLLVLCVGHHPLRAPLCVPSLRLGPAFARALDRRPPPRSCFRS